jgi:hypothetical protein
VIDDCFTSYCKKSGLGHYCPGGKARGSKEWTLRRYVRIKIKTVLKKPNLITFVDQTTVDSHKLGAMKARKERKK